MGALFKAACLFAIPGRQSWTVSTNECHCQCQSQSLRECQSRSLTVRQCHWHCQWVTATVTVWVTESQTILTVMSVTVTVRLWPVSVRQAARWPRGLEHWTGDRVVLAWVRITLWQLRFGTLAIPFTPLCQCLSEETLKSVGPFYLVSMPGEVKDPTSLYWKCVTCCVFRSS